MGMSYKPLPIYAQIEINGVLQPGYKTPAEIEEILNAPKEDLYKYMTKEDKQD